MNTDGLEAVRAAHPTRFGEAASAWAPVLVAAASTLLGVSSGTALMAGMLTALTLGNRWIERTRTLAHAVLVWAVVGLGAGMNLLQVVRAGANGLGYTAFGIGAALLLGTLLGKRFGVSRDVSLLISVGTAICGGSAIAAVAPVLRAKHHEVSMALVVVFTLNAVALFVFPVVGRLLHLDESSFGLWCALAIHDTSSVVGAASQFGPRALEIATAAKLARALWIVPVTFSIAFLRARTEPPFEEPAGKPRLPWFIGAFLAVAALVTFVPSLGAAGAVVSAIAHRSLALALCLVGLGFTRASLRQIGPRSLALAVALWIVLAGCSLALVLTSRAA